MCGEATPRYDFTASSTAKPILCGTAECNACNLHGNSHECLFAAPFCLPSNTSLCGGSISYGGSSSFIRGPWVTDTVRALHRALLCCLWYSCLCASPRSRSADLPPPRVSCRSATSCQRRLLRAAGSEVRDTCCCCATAERSPHSAAGILGLAHEWNAVNPTYIPTLFKNLVDSKQVDDKFGLCLTPSNGGTLDLGWVDDTKYTGEMTYINITKQRWVRQGLCVFVSRCSDDAAAPLHSTTCRCWTSSSMALQSGCPRARTGSTTTPWAPSSIGVYIAHTGCGASNRYVLMLTTGTLCGIGSGTSVMLFSPVIYSAIQSVWQSNFCHLPRTLS